MAEIDGRLIYAPPLYLATERTARFLLTLQREAQYIHMDDVQARVAAWEEVHEVHLAAAQREAVIASLSNGILVLTGGPGTGKTTVIRSIIDILEEQGLEILLGAPTGRAAKRRSEATGKPAEPIHSCLFATSDSADHRLR